MSYTEFSCSFAHFVKKVVLIKTSGYSEVWRFTPRVNRQTSLVSHSNRFGNCPCLWLMSTMLGRTYRSNCVLFANVDLGISQTHSHIRRNADDSVMNREIPWMDNIAISNPRFVFFSKPQQGCYRVALAGFYFDRVHLVFCFTVV